MLGKEGMDSVLAIVSRPTNSRPTIIIFENEATNGGGSANQAWDTSSQGKPIVCHAHKNSVCPECGIGCERRAYAGASVEIQHGETLQVANDEEIFARVGGAQDGVLFSWSPTDVNGNRLASLQCADELDISKAKAKTPNLAFHFGWAPRLIPQWDEQVKGLQIWDVGHRFRHIRFKPPSPLPPDQLSTTYCEECQLTWITGDAGAQGHSHPTHNALSAQDAAPYVLDQRSIVVHIRGENHDMVDQRKDGVGRLGIYFGENSKYNHSEPIYLTGESATRRCAEIHAARHALLIVKESVLPDYVARVEKQEQASSGSSYNMHQMAEKYRVEKPFELDTSSQDQMSTSEDQDDMDIRLVLATDSKNLVDLFCDQIRQWVYDEETREFRRADRKGGKKKGATVKNSEIISDFYDALNELVEAPVGVQVCWYHIPPQCNDEARKLANRSF
ncbi:hypothetical protein F4775DRAFT_550665 [Biscogniauxia sp. FL1348]|nr:hypothetical protein F4775DRAFT_550665 [Biscogniauxia sp. FL1348]